MQTDLKYINAYSSVSHCGLVLFAILMLNQTAMTGAVLQMLSHGLMTALFFALIGMIYGRTHTRDIREMGGLMRIMPFLGVCYVIAGLASLGLPGFSGFVAEMTVFVGSFEAYRHFPPGIHDPGCDVHRDHGRLCRCAWSGKLLYGRGAESRAPEADRRALAPSASRLATLIVCHRRAGHGSAVGIRHDRVTAWIPDY